MNKKAVIIGSIVGILAIGGVTWWLMNGNTSTPSSSTVTQTQQQPAKSESAGTSTSATGATITYTNSGFSPASITVKSGDTIRIVNQSSGSLQFSSDDHPAHTEHPELNMAPIAAGKEGNLKVTEPGTWGYHNHLKSNHEGSIIVTN